MKVKVKRGEPVHTMDITVTLNFTERQLRTWDKDDSVYKQVAKELCFS